MKISIETPKKYFVDVYDIRRIIQNHLGEIDGFEWIGAGMMMDGSSGDIKFKVGDDIFEVNIRKK